MNHDVQASVMAFTTEHARAELGGDTVGVFRLFEVAPGGVITVRHQVIHEHKPRPKPQSVMLRVETPGGRYLGQLITHYPGGYVDIPPYMLAQLAEETSADALTSGSLRLQVLWDG